MHESVSRFRTMLAIVALAIVVAACSPLASESEPEATTDTAQAAGNDQLSVDQVLAPVSSAWGKVENERVTTRWGNNLTDASPSSPAAAGQESVSIMVAPDARYIANRLGNVTMEEALVVDGNMYARGSRINPVIAPYSDPEIWVKVSDPSLLPQDEPVRYFLMGQIKPAQAPFSNLSQQTREQVAEDIGEIEIQGRTCQAYSFNESSADMGEWEIEVSLDVENGLPCRLVRTLDGNYQAVSIFEYNIANLTLARPATWIPASPIGAATPIVGPLGLPSQGPLSTPVPATPPASPSPGSRT